MPYIINHRLKHIASLGLYLLGIVSLLTLMPASTTLAQAPRCFDVPGITSCITGRFREYWEQNGGLPVFGYPLGPAVEGQTAEGVFLTQPFERNRFEIHPTLAPPYDVLLGRLGDDRLKQLGRDWRSEAAGRPTEGCLWFAETRHSVCDQEQGIGFQTFWRTHGLRDPRLDDYGRSLALFGLPLTEPGVETNAAGDRVVTQWFERARFEYHPSQPREFKVLLGLLGNEVGAVPPPGSPPPPPAAFDPGSFRLEVTRVAAGFARPTHVTHAGDGSGRLFVVEKAGRIRIVDDGVVRARPFLDVTDRVGASGSEQGLFAAAFHPAYRTNGFFFVNYTDKAGDTVIARYRVSGDGQVAEPGSATTIVTIDQPYANHNGGQLAFGPDGYLYIGMGDGGSGGDPHGNGQRRDTLLGKLLRIDVNSGSPYAVPRNNPFVDVPGARPEIWALGLRNPWRFSFDRETGDLFIADVGQNRLEEVNFQPAGSRGGENYGWNRMEGTDCFQPASGCNRAGLVLPIAEYGRDGGCSITGGFRYRGRQVPALNGGYLFADYCSGRIMGLGEDGRGGWVLSQLSDTGLRISSFGEDEQGELYVVDLVGSALYRIGAVPR